MKIALDLRAGGWLGGRYYLHNLVLAIRSLPETEQPELFGFLPEGDVHEFEGLLELGEPFPADADVVFPNWNVEGRTTAAQLHWIPDLQHRFLKHHFSRLERLKRDVGFSRFARRARFVVVSSNTVRRDAARFYPLFARRLRVLHFRTVVPDAALEADPRDTTRRYDLPDRFLLLPNQFWTHKNHATAFAAVSHLELPLVCTGATEDHREPTYYARLTKSLPPGGQSVRILGVVPRDDYLQLLRGSAAVVQPSLFEGWSSVVEDARALGRPIALSEIAVHREQDPPRARFFAPHDAIALATAVAAAVREGPAPEAEAVAAQQTLVAEYARRFLSLCREAAN